jgi:hypothetical protein
MILIMNMTEALIDKVKKRIYSFFPIIIFLSISLLVWLRLDKNYIFALDMIFPVKHSIDNFYFSYPLIINSTSWVIERIYLLFAMFLSGYSMYSLFCKFSKSQLSGLYVGLLYMINPYVYVRIMAGHLYILLSYAALPLLLITYIDLLQKKEKKELIKFIFLLTFVSFSLHILVIALILMTIIFLFWFNKHRDFRILKIFVLSAILFTLLNSYWIIPVLTAKDTVLDNINNEDFKIFAPKIENFSDLFNIAGMYGFWREGYIYAKDFIPYWQLLSVFIILLAIYGFISYYKDPEIGIYAKAIGLIGILGFVLASGINGPFGGINLWLYENTILKGFRDSQKFVAMLAVSYALLGGLGLSRFEAVSEKKKYLKAIIVIALIIPFIYSFTFFNSFAGQIKPTDYPADWYQVNGLLNQDTQDFKILFFPWHGYMEFKWLNNTDKRIANPSRNFFDKDVISSTTVELGNIYRQDSVPDQLYIDSLLQNKSNITNFGDLVSILNVKYIILAKEVDYKKYSFLLNQSDLELVKNTDTLYVFKNKNKVAKIYQTDNIDNIADKEEVKYKTISPVRFDIGEMNRKYLVFTEPYSQDWRLDGKESVKAYGAVNAFENSGKEIRFERFYRTNLPAYVISILTFVGLIAIYLR